MRFHLGKRFVFIFDMTRTVTDWRTRAVNAAEYDAWDKSIKRKLGWRGGLKFWSKTNVPGSYVLLSRHWPHLLCWDWSIWVGRHRGAKWDGPRKLILVFDRRYRNVTINLFGPYLRLTWQDSDYMAGIASGGPEIIWNHHVQTEVAE